MAAADVVITGTVLTVDDKRPTAEALAIADGRIIAVGTRADVADFIGPDTQTIDIGDGCVMPGFIEAHGHPLMEAVALSDRSSTSAPSPSLAPTMSSRRSTARPLGGERTAPT